MVKLLNVISKVEDTEEGWAKFRDRLSEGALEHDGEAMLRAIQKLSDQSCNKETLANRLEVAMTLCRLDASAISCRLLRFLREATATGDLRGSGLVKVVDSLTSLFPSVFRILYSPTPSAMDLWEEMLSVKDSISSVVERHSSESAVMIRIMRLLQLLVMSLTRKPTDDDSAMEDEEMTLDCLPRDGSCTLRHGMVREEASRILDILISILWRADLPLNASLAAFNLLGRIARRRPFLLAKIVPALIDKFESNGAGIEEHHKLFLEHTLEKQLASLIECPSAEKYYPLIVEALRKSSKYAAPKKRKADSETALPSASGAAATRDIQDEDEDNASTLANVGTKKIKSDSPIVADVEKIPLPAAIEIILSTLSKLSSEQIRGALEQWRPSPKIRDPRRQVEEVAVGVAENAEVKVDQVVPFELAPRLLDSSEQQQLLKSRLRALLASLEDASLIRDPVQRKVKIKSLLRLVALLRRFSGGDSPNFLDDMVLSFCFDGERLGERFSILMYWLRILWLDQEGDGYKTAYELAMERLQDLVTHATPQWEIYMQKFFSDAPCLLGDIHLALFEWICKTPATRLSGFVIVEALVKGRPAIRTHLSELVYGLTASSEDASLRKAAITIVTEGFFAIDGLRDSVIAFAHNLLNAIVEEDKVPVHMDLPIRLSLFSPQILNSTLAWIDGAQATQEAVEYVTRETLASASLVSPATYSALCKLAINDTRSGVFLGKLCEFLCKNSKQVRALLHFITIRVVLELIPKDGVDEAGEAVACGLWPARLLEHLVNVIENDDIFKRALTHFFNTVDPIDESKKGIYANILAKAAERVGAVELFVFLHEIEGKVPLKRLIDVIQICFVLTIVFKPDVLSSGFRQLVELPRLPTMLMRSIIQSISVHRALTGYTVGLLTKLINRSIWDLPKLWDGFIRCIKALGPMSHALLLQLPVEQLTSVLDSVPDMKPGFKAYLRQQSAAVQSRYPEELFMATH